MIALVSCSGPKLDRPAPARQLYTSGLFKKAAAHAERHFDGWFILSGLYGLVHPDQRIEPYDVDMTDLPIAQRRRWGRRVAGQIAARQLAGPFVALAGKAYREPLRGLVPLKPHPTNGLQIGYALQWYARNP